MLPEMIAGLMVLSIRFLFPYEVNFQIQDRMETHFGGRRAHGPRKAGSPVGEGYRASVAFNQEETRSWTACSCPL